MLGMTRLTSLDGSFLRLETPNAHMHVAWSGLFEPPAGTLPTPTVEALQAKVATRLARIPRFRQRLAFPPLRLAEPSWVDDHRFDVARHVTVPAEGGGPVSAERFRRLTDEMLSEPLDRARPLWHIYLVPRLEDGRLGLIFKMHHALVDGKSAVELALLLFDLSPDAEPEPMDDWRPAPPPNAARLALDAFASNAGEPLRAARGMARMAGRPGEGGLAGTLKRAALAFEQDLLRPAPSSYLNGDIGPERVLVRHRARMEDIVRAKQKAGVTVNDVCLAAVSGALRRAGAAAARAATTSEGDGPGERARRRPAPGPGQPHLLRVHRTAGGGAHARGSPRARARGDRRVQDIRAPRRHRGDAGRPRPAARPAEGPRGAARVERARVQPHGLEHPGAAVPAVHAGREAERGVSGRPAGRAACAVDRDVQLHGRPLLRAVRGSRGTARGGASCRTSCAAEIAALAGRRSAASAAAAARAETPGASSARLRVQR